MKNTEEMTNGKVIRIVLLRHGESVWNKANRFTGWTDVSLSKKGKEEARKAGKILREKNYDFDLVFESILKRSSETTDIVLREMKRDINKLKSNKVKEIEKLRNKSGKIKRISAWQLNERHYGALQGLNKAEMAEKYGEEQVHKWRRSYSIMPPALAKKDERYLEICRISKVPKNKVPLTESLKDTFNRVVPYFKKKILPEMKKGRKILISAHGNSLRALVKYLDNIPDDKITGLNIPTGIPLVYEIKYSKDKSLRTIKHYYLGDSKNIQKEMDLIKKQNIAKS